jgi:hypothetical protein
MSVTIVVESRIAAYPIENPAESLPHVFASVSIPVQLEELDNSQLTLDTVSQAIALNTERLDELFESTILNDHPSKNLETIGVNELDANALRLLLSLIDKGKVRIVASCTSVRESDDPLWYCIKVKKVL